MKKIIALLLVMCMLLPCAVFAAEEQMAKIYIFGDDWAADWSRELTGYVYDPTAIINCAQDGDLLTNITRKSVYGDIKSGDVVILSYGIMEKDRPYDKNADFKKKLEEVTLSLTQKGVTVMFVSVCSTMRYNTVTGQMDETKNYYTETTRSFAKTKNITYVDLASLTAKWANRLGSADSTRLYKSNMELTDNGYRMCAYEVFKHLVKIEGLKNNLKASLSQVYTVNPGETAKTFDVFFEDEICDYFTLYIKNGVNVYINGASVEAGKESAVCTSVGGRITVNFTSCEKLQLTPTYKMEAAGYQTTQAPFEGSINPGVYDVTVKKTQPLKASVYLNGYLVASNLDMPGTQVVETAAEHTYNEYHITDTRFAVTVKGLTDSLDYIAFRESPVIFDKKPRIFVGGDSTVCNYYPLERTGNEADGTVMTGWAMLLEKYVDADVVNLAASGDWAANWLVNSFPIVEKEGRAGDLFVVQFGINDHDKSTVEAMTAALGEMVDRCATKGIIPVLVSPQISAGYGWGNESNIGKSDGGAYEEFFNAVRELSTQKGCFYVDLTDLSSGWFSEVGRDNVYKKYHLWDYENNKPSDMMHLSYKGADAMCRFFVTGLEKLAKANKTDKWGNSLSLLKLW